MATRFPAGSSAGPAPYRSASPTATGSPGRPPVTVSATAPAYIGCFGFSRVGCR